MNRSKICIRAALAAAAMIAGTQAQAQAATTTTLAPTGAPVVGQAMSFTATLKSGGAPIAGNLKFQDGSVVMPGCGAVATVNGVASCTYVFASTGAHNVKAIFAATSGPPAYAASSDNIAENVIAAVDSSTVLTTTPNPATPGANVTLTANVSGASPGSGTLSGNVTFYDGSASLGTCALASATCGKATTFANGAHALTAVYGGFNANSYSASTSSVVTQSVKGGTPCSSPTRRRPTSRRTSR